MKKALIIIAVVLAVLATAAYVYRDVLMVVVMASQISPDHPFDATRAPTAPDYDAISSWAAHPDIEDAADQLPAGADHRELGVAAFFIHPTSYFGQENWNQPLEHADANWIVDERILRHQASVFNGCCDVYAPRYRQATFFSFMDTGGDGEAALDLAFGDVVAAWQSFAASLAPGQPFILAGHSQGSLHATRLLRETIAASDQLDQMVAAYLVGFSVAPGDTGGVPVCESATQTGCAVGWNAMDGFGAGAFGGPERLICVNPLSWTADESYAQHALNTGAIGFAEYTQVPGEDFTAMDVEIGIADAQCAEDGQLAVPELRSESFPARMFGNSMHVYDYSLFHMNIRDNAIARVKAFRTRP